MEAERTRVVYSTKPRPVEQDLGYKVLSPEKRKPYYGEGLIKALAKNNIWSRYGQPSKEPRTSRLNEAFFGPKVREQKAYDPNKCRQEALRAERRKRESISDLFDLTSLCG